jgi:AcrR family transcriptional regulator
MKTRSKGYNTKEALANAFLSRLEAVPINRITIQELSDACGINRQSFYHHFEDVYGLLGWIMRKDQEKLSGLQDRCLDWQEYALSLMQFLEQDKKKYCAISNALGWHYIEHFFQIDLRGLLNSLVVSYAKESGSLILRPKYVEFLQDYYYIALTALVDHWLKEKIDYTAEELVTNCDLLIRDEMRGAMQRSQAFFAQREPME